MSRKGLKFSGKITPLFPNMLTHAAEGEGSGEPTEPQPTPSPTQPSTGDHPPETSFSHASTQDSRETLAGTNGNKEDQELSVLCTNLSNRVLALESIKDAQVAEIIRGLERWSLKEKAKEKGVSIKDVNDLQTGKMYSHIAATSNNRLKHKHDWYMKRSREMEREREKRQRPRKHRSVAYIASYIDEVQAKWMLVEELSCLDTMEESKCRHNQLNKKTFEEIQALYIKEQERDADFVPIGSERDEKMIDKINKKGAGMDEEEVPEEPESTKVEVKQEGRKENIRKRSGRRLKMKTIKKSKRQKTDYDLDEEEQLRASLKIVPDEEEEIDYEVLGMRVFRANGSSRYIRTFTEMVSRFNRLDFIELHSLVMQRFSTITPEGIDLVLWEDLSIMFEETVDDDIWKNQEKWIIKSWTFYENCGVHLLGLTDVLNFTCLRKKRYPLIRETLERMMELRLTAESEGEAVFDCSDLFKNQIAKF
ncbi:hypothetical protein Tco_0295160 [Tanacetum coccineum]